MEPTAKWHVIACKNNCRRADNKNLQWEYKINFTWGKLPRLNCLQL